MSKRPENVKIVYLENRFKLHGQILISGHGTHMRLLHKLTAYNFPCGVCVPIGQGSHVKLLLNRNYQTQLLSGKDHFFCH